jgi:hypothetical protein
MDGACDRTVPFSFGECLLAFALHPKDSSALPTADSTIWMPAEQLKRRGI